MVNLQCFSQFFFLPIATNTKLLIKLVCIRANRYKLYFQSLFASTILLVRLAGFINILSTTNPIES